MSIKISALLILASIGALFAYSLTMVYMDGSLPLLPTVLLLLFDIMFTWFMIDEIWTAYDECQ